MFHLCPILGCNVEFYSLQFDSYSFYCVLEKLEKIMKNTPLNKALLVKLFEVNAEEKKPKYLLFSNNLLCVCVFCKCAVAGFWTKDTILMCQIEKL